MKVNLKIKKILVSAIFILFATVYSFSQDLPGNTPDIQTLPSGTLVIPMDNTLQQNSSGIFNLKAYGFIVELLNHSYKVKWIIKTGKAKDEADFSVFAEKLLPTYSAASLYNFKGGPFVIFPADSAGVSSYLENYNAGLAATEKVSMYRITTSVSGDVRYNLYKIPRIAILNDGSNTGIHTAYMTAAGIPAVNYTIRSAIGLTNDCITFASEPHISVNGPWVDSIRLYVQNGGNFLAQCHAIEIYEDATAGRFHATNGVNAVNRVASMANAVYSNPDMAFAQFEGPYNAYYKGSIRNWEKDPGGSFVNNHYSVIGNTAFPNMIGASVSKLKSGEGGLVFYLGNHEFDDLTKQEVVNGIRMYMNAMLMPSGFYCNYTIFALLPVKLEYFQAFKKPDRTVALEWLTSHEEKESWYIIERSIDGKNFTNIGTLDINGKKGVGQYEFIDENPNNGINYYRLRIENVNGKIFYSHTARVSMSSDLAKFTLYPNPATTFANIQTGLSTNENIQLKIADMAGRIVYHQKTTMQPQIKINTETLPAGMYWMMLIRESGEIIKNKLIVN